MIMNEVQTQKRNVQPAEPPTLQPYVDVYEDATGLTLLVDMPGVAKDSIELKLEGDALSITGEMTGLNVEGLAPTYAEVTAGRYKRAFTLSRELDAGRIEASGKDGVLTLRIPKTERAQPRRIEVRSS
jgi:HSP20 family molecular chaperone IbpA